jgi:hypothetical protein
MSPEEIAAGFRAAELQRREARRKILLNHAALDEEKLTSPVDIQANAAALKRISLQQLEYENKLREARPRLGYWRRLWFALINKELP